MTTSSSNRTDSRASTPPAGPRTPTANAAPGARWTNPFGPPPPPPRGMPDPHAPWRPHPSLTAFVRAALLRARFQ